MLARYRPRRQRSALIYRWSVVPLALNSSRGSLNLNSTWDGHGAHISGTISGTSLALDFPTCGRGPLVAPT